MKKIYISLNEDANPPDRLTHLQNLCREAGIEPASTCTVLRAQNGKPILSFNPAQIVGYSNSHVRRGKESINILALIEGRDIGIDLEFWPHGGSDSEFLKTVASNEDWSVLQRLQKSGHDAGIALWVIKEAALKCTGDVMVDPRDLAVHFKHDNLFAVSSSASAKAPHPEIDVALHILATIKDPNAIFLVGVALASGVHEENRKERVTQFNSSGWEMKKILN
jgi:phosphopantetheinyl transferase